MAYSKETREDDTLQVPVGDPQCPFDDRCPHRKQRPVARDIFRRRIDEPAKPIQKKCTQQITRNV